MTTTTRTRGPTALKVVQPADGELGGLGPGMGVQFEIDGADTGRIVSIVPSTSAPW